MKKNSNRLRAAGMASVCLLAVWPGARAAAACLHVTAPHASMAPVAPETSVTSATFEATTHATKACTFQSAVGVDPAVALQRVGTTVVVNSPSSTIIVNNPPPVIINRPAPVIVTTAPPPSFTFRPEELLPYLSPRCAELNEAIRRGPVRGTRTMDAVNGMRTEYQSRCQDDERDARERLYHDKMAQRNETLSQRSAVQTATSQARLSHEQCDEMLRILVAKRKRLDTLSDGEKSDHQRFESNYVARCKAG